MVSKKQLLVSILIILTFSLVILGGSYAYFSANVNGDPISNTVEAAMLGSVDFVAGPNVQVPEGGIFPGWIGVQEFSINKPADMNAGVGAFEILMDTTVDPAYGDWVTYEVYKTTDGDTITRVEGDLVISPEGFASQEDSLTAVGFNIPSSALKKGTMNNTTGVVSLHKENFDLATYQDTTYYVVYRFNNESLDQSVAMGKEFSAMIKVIPTEQFNIDVENMEMILAESTQYYEDLGVTPEPIDNFTYTEHLYHAEIVSYTGTSTDVVIPNEINGKPVTVLKAASFSSKTSITNFTFPSSLEIVENNALPINNKFQNYTGSYAFADKEKTFLIRYGNSSTVACPATMEIPEGTKYIYPHLCIGDRTVSTLTIPDSVEFIGINSFYDNKISSINLSESLKYIADGVFGQNDLTSVIIPNNVIYIGTSAFYENSITSLKLGESVEYIGNNTFSINQIESLEIPSSVKEIETGAFSSNRITDLVFNEGLEIIGNGAFNRVQDTTVELPSTLKEIGDYAFQESYFKTITIPTSVMILGEGVFYGISGFTANIEGKDSSKDFEEFGANPFGIGNYVNYLGK